MKYQIVIGSDDPNELLRLLSSVAGVPVVTFAPQTDGDDTDGDDTDGNGAAPIPSATPGSTTGVDIHNMPWDERIHASTGAKNSDGTWRAKRNLDPNVKAAVEAELRARMGQPIATAAAPIPPAPIPQAAPVAAIPQPVAPAPVMPAPVAAPAPAPVAPAPSPIIYPAAAPAPVAAPVAAPAAPAAGPIVDYPFVLAAIQRGVNAGKIDAAYVQSLMNELGVADISLLLNDATKCWAAYTALDRDQKYIAA